MQPYDTPPPGYRPPPHLQYPEASQSTTVLVLGILSLVFCGVLGPVAWIIGNKELAAIDQGRRSPVNREHANIGRILGIVSSALMAIGLIFMVLWFLFVGTLLIGGVAGAAG